MLSKSQIQYIQGLKLKKYRQKYAEFIIEGSKLVTEALSAGIAVHRIIATTAWIDAHAALLPPQPPVEAVPESLLGRLSSMRSAPEVLAVLPCFPHIGNDFSCPGHWSLALDGIQDPGNMGTLLRSADWFGIPQIFCSEDCVELYNPKVVQASMGSIFRVQVISADLHDVLQTCAVPRYAAMPEGNSLYGARFGKEGILIIGNEARGISDSLLDLCDTRISIPGSGGAESLNAAMAGSIILSHIRREDALNLNF